MADIESALLTLFDDLAYTVTSTPLNLKDVLPVILVNRIGGPGDPNNDYPTIRIQHFAAVSSSDPRTHWDLAQATEDRLFEIAVYGPQKVGGVCLEDPAMSSGPVSQPYPDAGIGVTETIWRLTARR